MTKLPPAMTPRQIPTTGNFEAVFWRPGSAPVRVHGLLAKLTVSLMDPETGRTLGYVSANAGLLWAALFYDDLAAAHAAGVVPQGSSDGR